MDSMDRLPLKTILFVRYSGIGRNEEFRNWINGMDAGYAQDKYSWYVLGGKVQDKVLQASL